MAEALSIRGSVRGEEELLAHAAFRSFRVGTAEGWTQYFRENPHVHDGATVVAEWNGQRAGSATALDFTMSLAGVDVPMKGVAAVAVLPEYRRRGIADALMRSLVTTMKSQGAALSLLYPFKVSYYARFGYALVETWDHLRVGPWQLPSSPLRTNVEPATERDRPVVRALYEALRARTTGQLVRSDYWWTERIQRRTPECAVYRDPATGTVDGYVMYEVPGEPAYPGQVFRAREIRARTSDAHRGLMGFLAALGEQYSTVEMCLPRGEACTAVTDFGLVGAPRELASYDLVGVLTSGAMARVLDVPKALAMHPSPAKHGPWGATFGLDVTDPCAGKDPLRYDVIVTPDGAVATPGGASTERLALSIGELSRVYLGAAKSTALLARGYARGSVQAAEILDACLAGPEVYLGLLNGF